MRANSLVKFDRKINSLGSTIDSLDWATRMSAITLPSVKVQTSAAAMLGQAALNSRSDTYRQLAKVGTAGILGKDATGVKIKEVIAGVNAARPKVRDETAGIDSLRPSVKQGLLGIGAIDPSWKGTVRGISAMEPVYKAGLTGGLDRKYGQAFADAIGLNPTIKAAVEGLSWENSFGADLIRPNPKFSTAARAALGLDRPIYARDAFKPLLADFMRGSKFGPNVTRTIDKLSPMMSEATLRRIADPHDPLSDFDVGETGRLARQWSRPVATPLDIEQIAAEGAEPVAPEVTPEQRAWLKRLPLGTRLVLIGKCLGVLLAVEAGQRVLPATYAWIGGILYALLDGIGEVLKSRDE